VAHYWEKLLAYIAQRINKPCAWFAECRVQVEEAAGGELARDEESSGNPFAQ
jgi:hypothetical protein